ncbi:multiheme c-type cytochrome [Oceanidesulfovibrio indonesiensis]|nr:multiheme c-type cytochrome [Oceanidesulfovibrio indonesiensis]
MWRILTMLTAGGLFAVLCFGIVVPGQALEEKNAEEAPVSGDSSQCLACHEALHPGIVEGWRKSRHARRTPAQALEESELARRISSEDIPEELMNNAVGCAECHTMRPEAHADTFEHAGFDVHIVVSPDDCETCHRTERQQYSENLMAHAYGNLENNPLYQQLVISVNGIPERKEDGRVEFSGNDPQTYAESCLYCHGTKLSVSGTKARETDYGTFDVPVIDGWPNQGSGRVNLDGSLGSCTACHTRHKFSIEEARSPSTCRECHEGPDVPAYKIYMNSKHGGIYSSGHKDWDFSAVPWTVGEDFRSPTCATCHASLLTTPDGTVVAERTHAMKERLPWRIFGLIYAHPQPVNPDTSIIVNEQGIHLPTTLDGDFAMEYLIDEKEQAARTETMQSVCRSCHGDNWVDGHWARFENTIRQTNAQTLAATRLISEAWKEGYNRGPEQGESPFDEHGERIWSGLWLFSANHVRFASAMAGGGDYGVFADGRYHMTDRYLELHDWLETQRKLSETAEAK